MGAKAGGKTAADRYQTVLTQVQNSCQGGDERVAYGMKIERCLADGKACCYEMMGAMDKASLP